MSLSLEGCEANDRAVAAQIKAEEEQRRLDTATRYARLQK